MNRLIKKYNNLSKPVRAAIWFTICNFALKGITFVCMPLFTRLMPSDEYGKMSLIVTYESIFNIFATFELSLGAYQRGILKYKDDLGTFEQSIVMLSNTITVLFFIVVCIVWKPFYSFTHIPFVIFGLMCIYFLVFTPYNCWVNNKRFSYDYRPAVIVTLAMAIISNILPVISLNLIARKAVVKVGSTLIAGIIFCLPFWLRKWDIKNAIENRERIKEYYKYALVFQGPLVFHSLSYYVLNQSDRIMIGWFSNNSKVAYYSVAYSLANVIIIFQNSLNQVLKPWRFQKLEKKEYKDIRDTSNALIIIVGAVITLFALAVPDVLKLIFKPEYYEAVKTMAPVAFSVYFLFLYSIFVDIESYYSRTKYIAYVSVFCAALNVALNYVGIKMFGYTACAYTTLICYAIMALLHYVFMKRTCKEFNLEEMPVDSKNILFFSMIMLLMFAIVSVCYHSSVIRYCVFGGIFILGVINYRSIIRVMRTIMRKKAA